MHQSGDQFSLRIPMVVGCATTRRRWCRASICAPATMAGAPPPTIRFRTAIASRRRSSTRSDHAPVNPTTISIHLQAGFPLGDVKSHFHNVKIDSPDSATRVITLADGAVPADRDFELTWTAAAEEDAVRRRVSRARRRRRLSFGLRHAAGRERRGAKAAAARGDLCHRQFRLDGRHLDRPSQGRPALRALPIAAERPVQRHPFR